MKVSISVFALLLQLWAPACATGDRGSEQVARALARLSLWVSPGRKVEFEAVYQEKLAPIVKTHGLVASSKRGRVTPDSVFTRLFELETPSGVANRAKALQRDSRWLEALEGLGAAFGTAGMGRFLRFSFDLYAAPAGPGRVVRGGGGRGYWRLYDVTDGIGDGAVLSIFQDREGYLWFGTDSSVSRYDGRDWITFTTADGLAGNKVRSILQDREGYLWLGAEGGVSRCDPLRLAGARSRKALRQSQGSGGAGRAFVSFTIADGLASSDVRSVFQDREGHLWFGTNGGVSRYDPSATQPVAPTGSQPSSLLRAGGKAWTTFTTRDGLADNAVNAILQDREGHLWFGTNGGVSRYDPSASSGQALRQSSGQALRQSSGQAWTTFTAVDELASGKVLSVLQDGEGHFWFGTSAGVTRYDGQDVTTFTPTDGLAGVKVRSIFQDGRGYLWFGTPAGVSRYDGQGFTTFTAADGLASQDVWSIFQDRGGHLWFGTSAGVSRYDGKVFTTFTTADGLAGRDVWSIFEDREGRLWFGTPSGVSRYDGKVFTTFTVTDGLANNVVRSILQDGEGNLWFGTNGDGVSRYDGETWITFTTQDGLADNVVNAILRDREGHLWFGTNGGVSRYDPLRQSSGQASTSSGQGGKGFTTFTPADGLTSNRVWSMLQDREGHLWFGTWGAGVTQYDPSVRSGEAGRIFQTLTFRDGLAENNVYSILEDREGYIWIGTDKGVTRYRSQAPSAPPVFVDAVVTDRRYERVSEFSFPSSVKLMAFEFRGISFKTRPEMMAYRYRLKGHDESWKTTRAKRVEYQDLPRGTYTFEVVAVDRDLAYSSSPASVVVRVRMPYERIGWMSALGIAVALVAWQSIRVIRRDMLLRASNAALSTANRELFGLNRELQEKTEDLEEKTESLEEANRRLDESNRALSAASAQVQEATRRKSQFLANMSHELRTPLTAIKGFADNMLDGIGGVLNDRQGRYLSRILSNTDHLMTVINDILDLSRIEAGRLDIKSAPFEVKKLIVSCCETVGPMLKPGVALNYEVAGDVGEAHTDEARLRQIVINLLSNAVKFTEQGEVRVHVTRPPTADRRPPSPVLGSPSSVVGRPSEDGFLEIAVSDTGIGIPPDALGYIFDEFRQVEGRHQQQKGTGLGLSITKRLTELLGGAISVESEIGKGSTFTVRVPLVYPGN